MKLSLFVAVCAVGVSLSVGAGNAQAQPPVPGGGYSRPPAFSPYLNLLRGGGSPALNYYGIVRPEMQFRQSIQNLSNDINLNQQAIGDLAAGGGLPLTGHSTQFMNLGGYFMNSSGGQIGGAALPAPTRSAGLGGPPRRR